jgi:PDZ domain-containing secreted protein
MSADGSIILGDLVTAVNGEPVRQAEDLISAIEEKSEGSTVTLSVQRKSDPRRSEIVQVTLTTRDKLENSNPVTRRTGMGGMNNRRPMSRPLSIWE